MKRKKMVLQEDVFRGKLKHVVKTTLASLATVGALSLANCGNPEQTTESTVESTKENLTQVETIQEEEKIFEEVIPREIPVSVDGRRPDGLLCLDAETTIGELSEREMLSALFANSAYLESAAVVAFEYLARELEAYHAPSSLIEVAYEAVDEEIEHAALMTQLAAYFGSAQIPTVEVSPFKLRPLHEIAYENSLEGCTRETYGALKALWQAETAEEAVVREVIAKIGYDESRHAALSWAIDAWVRPLLTQEQQALCEQVKNEALVALRQETSRPIHPALIRWAGWPSPQAANLLLQKAFLV